MIEITELLDKLEGTHSFGSTAKILRLLVAKVEALERTVDDLVNIVEPPKGLFSPAPASGGPKQEAGLWSENDPAPCVHCHQLTKTSFNAVPMHMSCVQPAPPDAGTQHGPYAGINKQGHYSHAEPAAPGEGGGMTKQKLDGVRTLAIKLFEAGEAEKRKQPKEIWGEPRDWRDLPSESVAVWDAIAICAYRQLRPLK